MPDRPTLAHGHVPLPGMLLRSDDTAKRGLWYVHAVTPDGFHGGRAAAHDLHGSRQRRAAYYHTTSAVDDAWQLEYAPAST